MTPRTPVPEGFRPACELAIPAGAKSAVSDGQSLALPKPNPAHVVVIGDTGCRIKGLRVQDCNDPEKWPLPRIAAAAAPDRPDLVVHVGDYVYRENTSTPPAGDSWEAWNADFFTPATKLLAASPWAFTRGNHEDCSHFWRGWFYYLDPRPFTAAACQSYAAPYVVQLGTFQMAMLDSSAVKEKEKEEDQEQVRIYASELATLRTTKGWLVAHQPFWGLKAPAGDGAPTALTATLAEAWRRTSPQSIDLVISGHTHLFELLSFDGKRPPQLIAGDGGTDLSKPLPDSVTGLSISGLAIEAATIKRQFGYTALNKIDSGWSIVLRSPVNGAIVTCTALNKRAACLPPVVK